MKQWIHHLSVATSGRGLVAITAPILAWVQAERIGRGQLCVWCRHASASLIVQDNADPTVLREIERFFEALIPDEPGLFAPLADGADGIPAYIRAALCQTQLAVPIMDGWPVLGSRQGIFLWEHREGQQRREVVLHALGER